ncbi:MAG: sulfotransferase [Pseudomonadota bacterium]
MTNGRTLPKNWRERHPAPGPLIVQIGFNKCGTRSISRLLGLNAIPRVDWKRGKIARDAVARMAKGEPPFADYPNAIGFTDVENMRVWQPPMTEFYREFAYIYQHYPDAYFILNTRDKAAWLKSRLNHKNYVWKYRWFLKTWSRDAIVAQWSADWDAHHAAVEAFFADKPGRLCVYNIETDKPSKLAAFLAPSYAITTLELPHRGETGRKKPLFRRPGWIKPRKIRKALGLPPVD